MKAYILGWWQQVNGEWQHFDQETYCDNDNIYVEVPQDATEHIIIREYHEAPVPAVKENEK